VMWKAGHEGLENVSRNEETGESLVRILCKPSEYFNEYDLGILEVQLLDKKYVNKDEVDPKTGYTLLHEATQNPDLIGVLIRKGISPNSVDKNGDTPLHKALREGATTERYGTIKHLIDGGCNQEIKNNEGKTAFQMLKSTPEDQLIAPMFDVATIASLQTPITVDEKGIVHSGMLKKEGSSFSTWRSRLCELTKLELRYLDPQTKKEKGTIPITEISDVASVTEKKEFSKKTALESFKTEKHNMKIETKVNNCFKIPTVSRIYYFSADNQEDMKLWISKINALLAQVKKERDQIMKSKKESIQVNFTGEWVLDLKGSESIDHILKALGRSWVDRQLVHRTPVTQNITQDSNKLIVQNVAAKMLTKTEVFSWDGNLSVRESDTYAQGKVKLSNKWDQNKLVTETQLNAQGKEATLISTRYLENESTMILNLQLKFADGTGLTAARRIFKKVQ